MKKIISILTIIAIPLGILLGYFLHNVKEYLEFIGTIYLNLLKFLVVPLIFCSISYTIYNATLKKEKTVVKSVILFIIMFTVTFSPGLILVLLTVTSREFSGIEAALLEI